MIARVGPLSLQTASRANRVSWTRLHYSYSNSCRSLRAGGIMTACTWVAVRPGLLETMTLVLCLAQSELSPGAIAGLRDRVIATLEEPDDDEYLRVWPQIPS